MGGVVGIGKKGGGFGATLASALVIVVLAVGIGLGLSTYGHRLPVIGWFFEVPVQTTTSPVVVEGIQRLDQLATVRFSESTIVTKESGGEGIRRLLTGEQLILAAQGEVEAGVDLSAVDKNDVSVNGQSVSINLPEPQIVSVSLDEKETRIYDRDMGLMPRITPSDDLAEEARDDAEERIEQAARENDILDYADRNAEDSIRAFLLALDFEEVRFE